jgi:hypothetical protein
MSTAIYYHFRQNLNVPARKAYSWCVDYQPGSGDHKLMGNPDADRKISRLSDRTIILTDTFRIGESPVEKQKLVQMYPELLFWTNTHLTGPARHSQFLYQIAEDGEEVSHLDFTGLSLDYTHEEMSKADAQRLSEKLCKEDADCWKLLAEAMKKDFETGAH